mmetsp:Transcript_68474/g.222851  ORF Transcript_68474/g.222851 Transcript_68474/m.222851 type:complete len:325 (+) Transcript_68474:1126-2100(+)
MTNLGSKEERRLLLGGGRIRVRAPLRDDANELDMAVLRGKVQRHIALLVADIDLRLRLAQPSRNFRLIPHRTHVQSCAPVSGDSVLVGIELEHEHLHEFLVPVKRRDVQGGQATVLGRVHVCARDAQLPDAVAMPSSRCDVQGRRVAVAGINEIRIRRCGKGTLDSLLVALLSDDLQPCGHLLVVGEQLQLDRLWVAQGDHGAPVLGVGKSIPHQPLDGGGYVEQVEDFELHLANRCVRREGQLQSTMFERSSDEQLMLTSLWYPAAQKVRRGLASFRHIFLVCHPDCLSQQPSSATAAPAIPETSLPRWPPWCKKHHKVTQRE